MKYFAEYLVEKGILNQEKLIEIMIDQVENSPSTARLVQQTHLLTAEQILQVFKVQSEKNIEFKKACEDLGFWTLDLEVAVRAEFNKQRQPFGVSILSMGLMNLEQLTKHFDEYFAAQAKALAAENAEQAQKAS